MDTFKEPEYKNRVAVQAAATVCLAVGCRRAEEAVLDTLADIIKEYVKTIGTHANNIAEAGGRTVVTPLDALSALKQMGAFWSLVENV
jgi:histone H3/H4